MCTRCYSIHVCVASSHLFCHVYLFHFVGWFCFMFHVSFSKTFSWFSFRILFTIFVMRLAKENIPLRFELLRCFFWIISKMFIGFYLQRVQFLRCMEYVAISISSVLLLYYPCWSECLALVEALKGAQKGTLKLLFEICIDEKTSARPRSHRIYYQIFCFSVFHFACTTSTVTVHFYVHCTSMAMSCVCMWWIQCDLIASKCAVIIPFLFRFNDVVYYLFGWMEKCNDCVA